MKTINCDVAIVGAGPAGLATAITTSKAGLKTVVVEKNSEIGYPIKTSAFTLKETWEKWRLPKKVVYQEIDSLYLHSAHSDRKVEIDFGRTVGGILDYHIFLRELAYKAIKNKTEILLSERVKEPIKKNSCVAGVKTSLREINSKIVVDASGPEAVIAKKEGLSDFSGKEIGIGIEYEMYGVEARNRRSIDLFVGREVVPVGYGWIFPAGPGCARVGVCTVYNTQEKVEKRDIRYWLEKFLDKKSPVYSRIRNAQPYEVHVGAYPLSGAIKKPFADGLLAVGDSASHASMLFGEGIRYAMSLGKKAGETIIDSISEGDYSEKFLSKYMEKCNKFFGGTYEVALELLQVPTDEYWEALIDSFTRLKKEGEIELILKYMKTEADYEDAKRIFPQFKGKYLSR